MLSGPEGVFYLRAVYVILIYEGINTLAVKEVLDFFKGCRICVFLPLFVGSKSLDIYNSIPGKEFSEIMGFLIVRIVISTGKWQRRRWFFIFVIVATYSDV